WHYTHFLISFYNHYYYELITILKLQTCLGSVLEDNVLVAVFPSTFSQNKIKPIITNIKKILKIQNKKFHKIRQDGDI
mgnify:CR=1